MLFILVTESLGAPLNVAPKASTSLLHPSPRPGLAFLSRSFHLKRLTSKNVPSPE